MINKLFYSIVYLVLKLLYLISRKLNFYDFYDFVSFYLIRSNHPKRLDLIKYKLINKIPNKQNKLFFLGDIKSNKKIIFLGDSHVEFFSRVTEIKNYFIPNNIYSLWLGPRTVIGLNYDENIKQLRKKIKFINNLNFKDFTLVLSIGSIDVRCLYYEIIFRKLVQSNEQLYSLFEKNLILFLNELRKIKFKKKFYFIGLFNSRDKGFEFSDLGELLEYKNKNDFPTFGNFKTRSIWTKKTNILITKILKNYSINLISIKSLTDSLKNDEILDDNVHLVSEKIYRHIYKIIGIKNELL